MNHFTNPAPEYNRPLRPDYDYFQGRLRKYGHKGIDIYGPRGIPILAAHSGRVYDAGKLNDDAGFGVEILEHIKGVNGYWLTRYLHCEEGSILVKNGDAIRRGTKIGRMGNSGNANAVHLHFETRWVPVNQLNPNLRGVDLGTPIDPLPALYPDTFVHQWEAAFRRNGFEIVDIVDGVPDPETVRLAVNQFVRQNA